MTLIVRICVMGYFVTLIQLAMYLITCISGQKCSITDQYVFVCSLLNGQLSIIHITHYSSFLLW